VFAAGKPEKTLAGSENQTHLFTGRLVRACIWRTASEGGPYMRAALPAKAPTPKEAAAP